MTTINVTTTRYNGSDFPEAEGWDQWLATALGDLYPGADVSVEYGANTSVKVSGFEESETKDFEQEIRWTMTDLWEGFCSYGYKEVTESLED